jgi:hypothetical protein
MSQPEAEHQAGPHQSLLLSQQFLLQQLETLEADHLAAVSSEEITDDLAVPGDWISAVLNAAVF